MSLVYLLSKFSQEAILLELLSLGLLGTAYFGYLLFKKRKYGVAKKQIPDHVVRAFLMDMMSRTEGFKNQLFGESFHIPTATVAHEPHLHTTASAAVAGVAATLTAAAPVATAGITGKVDDETLKKLSAELQASLGKQDELGKALTKIQDEKAALEAKLAQAGSGSAPAPDAAGGDSKETLDKIAKLEAKLAEYEVIEDDLANLKRYQQENKQLKAQLAATQNGGATPAVASAVAAAAEAAPAEPATETAAPVEAAAAEAPAPEAAASPLAAAEEAAATSSAEKELEGLAGKVEESLAEVPTPEAPLGASVSDPFAEAAAAPAADPVAAPDATAAVPTDKPAGDKSDADLLSEFEKMLSS